MGMSISRVHTHWVACIRMHGYDKFTSAYRLGRVYTDAWAWQFHECIQIGLLGYGYMGIAIARRVEEEEA